MINRDGAGQYFAVAFPALLAAPLLYILRALDGNALTSWRWVFAGAGVGKIYALTALGVLLSYFFSKASLPERRPLIFLLGLSFLVALPLRAEPEVIPDASRYFVQAKYLELYGVEYFVREWGKTIGAWTDMPVVPFLYGLIFKFFGETRTYIQLFNALLFSATIVLTYLTGKALYGERQGFYAGLLLTAIPYLPTQVPLMLVDIPAMFFLTLSIYTFTKAIEKGGLVWPGTASAAVFLTTFSKYSTWPMLSVLAVISCVSLRGRTREVAGRTAVIAGLTAVLCGMFFLAKLDVLFEQLDMLKAYQWPGLLRWQEGYISTFLFQTHPFVTALSLFGAFAAFKNKDRRFLVAAWFVLLVVVFRMNRVRYVLPMLPLFTLMASYGLCVVKDGRLARFIAYSAAASSLVILFCAYLPFLDGMSAANLKDAGVYLDSLPCESVEVYALPQPVSDGNTEAAVPVLDLFTSKRLVYRGAKPGLPAKDGIEKSSLRFTWELKMPDFYSGTDKDAGLPLVVISGEAAAAAASPEMRDYAASRGLKTGPAAVFLKSSGVFRYKTFVTIFSEGCLSGKVQ
ncbi:MAG: glycosyltransferase family 39 protein [Nitrospirae bacterium]|nr:MAG: glycosyltransferase family 39 protein [Nitrospirota bacterium]